MITIEATIAAVQASTDPIFLAGAARSNDALIRQAVAVNPATDMDTLTVLAGDDDSFVAGSAAVRIDPNLGWNHNTHTVNTPLDDTVDVEAEQALAAFTGGFSPEQRTRLTAAYTAEQIRAYRSTIIARLRHRVPFHKAFIWEWDNPEDGLRALRMDVADEIGVFYQHLTGDKRAAFDELVEEVRFYVQEW